jgi:hypothetical protein
VCTVDPLELEVRRHLDVGHHDVGPSLLGLGEERRPIRRHADDLDVLEGLE